MPLTNGYATLATAKSYLAITRDAYDARLESLITAVSRQIDEHCGRRFYAASDTRYYTATDPYCLDLADDLRTVTTLKTDEDGDRTYEITWDSSDDYYLTPYNAVTDGRPYTGIEVDRTNGDYTFPCRPRGVQIVGSFGYCATGSQPAAVEEACLRLVKRLTDEVQTAGAEVIAPNLGRIVSRDVLDLLWPYVRRRGFA